MDDKPASGPGALYLASSECGGLAEWLAELRRPGPIAVITAASDPLADRGAIVEPLVAAARASGGTSIVLDLQTDALPVLEAAGAVLMPGGDPFRLLRMLRATGAAPVIARRHAAGMPVAGQSAGAMVCAPDLAPLTGTSPFAPEPGQDLEGLGLTRSLVLVHHDRPGRAARHREAAARHGASHDLRPLWDGEVLREDVAGWRIIQGTVVTRPARVGDAPAVEAVFRAATEAAWASFIGADALRRAPQDAGRWRARIERAGERFLIAEDQAGLLGFVLFEGVSDPVLEPHAMGEVDLLYTQPRAWGRGIGRRLLDRATFALRAAGYREAVLWTEARNTRALAVYRRSGWVPDGAFEDRDYLGVRIRNLRHRFDLVRRAGGLEPSV